MYNKFVDRLKSTHDTSQEHRIRRSATMFTPSEYAAIEAVAAEAHCTVSQVIRGALVAQGVFPLA